MIKNYLKIAFRNIIRHKAFAAINIAGLAIGMACSIFILLWVQNELSYDRFNKNANEIYRIAARAGDFKVAINPAPMVADLQAKMPVIRNTVRLATSSNVFEVGERKFEEKRVFYADSTFLQVFSYRLLKGDRASVLNRPDAVLITEDLAKKYFGHEDALGKILRKDNNKDVIVTGILANIPSNSHLQFDCILPMSSIAQTNDNIKNQVWDNFDFYAYVQLDKTSGPSSANIAKFNKQMDDIYKTHVSEKTLKVNFWLQPLTAIHLHSNYQVDLPGHGNIQYVNIFFVVALFILSVACINFMNLATARSARRAKEVGLRKVVGAGRKQLIGQFLGESMLISFVSLILATGIVWLLLPLFNDLAGKKLSIHLLDRRIITILVTIALATGLISGSYPALFLSGFQPVKVLKGNVKTMGGNLIFRNGLVVVQFVVSIMLLAGTAIVYRQLNFIKSMNLGFDKSNLLYLPMAGEMWNKQQALKAELKQNPLTSNYAITSDLPVDLASGTVNVHWEGKDPKSQVVFPTLMVDEGFFNVFQMKILSGRVFSPEFKSDSTNFIVNEKAVQVMGMKVSNAVGKSLSLWDNKGTIIGVVKNFNYKPIQQPIEPMILALNRWGGTAVIRTQPGKTEATIKALGKISADLNPGYPFSYGFLDQDLANQYKGEQRMGSLFNVFAVLAIFISCMGLYGLSAFMAEQRTKEIGVRKVLGASVFKVVYLLSTGFTKLILIAVVIAVPLAWFAINSWLKSFAFRVNADWMVFLIASLAALAIAWLTVSYESIKAAIANPVKSLRNE
ncbi:MAG TPA: ABC transporter permease [Chitinophagaceae bacterium]|jgi:predicted permease|nr:ABC transporter permease [Chitinophagaceae bacterium]